MVGVRSKGRGRPAASSIQRHLLFIVPKLLKSFAIILANFLPSYSFLSIEIWKGSVIMKIWGKLFAFADGKMFLSIFSKEISTS